MLLNEVVQKPEDFPAKGETAAFQRPVRRQSLRPSYLVSSAVMWTRLLNWALVIV